MWHIQNFASPSLKKFPLPAQETNLSNPPCQVISFSLNHVPSGTAYWQFSISFLSVANARSCSPIAAKFSSHLITHWHSQATPISLNTSHFDFFLLLTQVQPHSLAELCLGLFLHFLLYLVHGPVFSCIFFSTASQPHAFFMSLCASGFSPNPLESPCIYLNSVSRPLSQKIYFFPS